MRPSRIGRRDVLRLGAGAGLATMLPACGNDNVDAPAIVIGSGFGGAIASLRLTQKGMKTILLERGKRWTIDNPPQASDPFCTNLAPDWRAAWLQENTDTPALFPMLPISKGLGVLDLIPGVGANGFDVYAGAGYGGGSLVYGGITLQPSQQRFELNFPAEISYDQMNKVYFPRVLAMLQNPSSTPDDIAANAVYDYVRTFQPVAAAAGLDVVPLPTVTNWDIIRNELAGQYGFQSATNGELIYGNNTGSKITLDQTYLKQAEATGKLDVRLQTQAVNVTTDGNRYLVHVNQIDELGNTVSSQTLACNYLFLACGSVYTTQLLFNSRQAAGGLKNVNEQLGQNWGSNGDCMFMLQGYNTPTGVQQGGPPVIGIDDANNPIAPGYVELAQYPTDYESHTTVHLGVAMTKTLGQLVFNPMTGLCGASMNPGAAAEIQAAVASITTKLQNGYMTLNPSATPLAAKFLTGFTYHPLGGAAMNQVCDTFGRVDGYKNLYVVDSALVPGPSVGINPSLTIAAIIERAMDSIVANDLKS